jgi:hypothetical protein
MSFEKNIFINCPFDYDYAPILKSLIFISIYFQFEPQISKTVSSSHLRINEIMKLIQTSKYSIHDISRCEPLKTGELPRFNMPYEMGLDIGCSIYGTKLERTKQCLILERIKNRYDIVISDISGQDIMEHNNKPKKAIKNVMEWFASCGAVDINIIPGLSNVWAKYLECTAKIEITLINGGFTKGEIKNLSIPFYIKAIKSALL